ncbi:hypothetical protein ACTXT7_004731 [Hymenolepis weldensis]
MDYKVIDRVGDCRFVHGLQHSEKTSISEGIHLPTGVKVRLKTVRCANMEDFERGQELFREATILARLSHPNIIHIYHLIKDPKSENFSSALILPIRKGVTSASCSPEFTAPELIEENLDIVRPEAVSWSLPKPDCLPQLEVEISNKQNAKIKGRNADSDDVIDISPSGVVLFYMLVGELPFQSPYYDHKRRGRLLRFAQRGLTPNHINAISDFTPDCQLLLRQLLEPRAIIRIPICELCTNSWITNSGSMLFQPFSPCSAHFFTSIEAVSVINSIWQVNAEIEVHYALGDNLPSTEKLATD